jgi:hypothetical protein
VHFRNPSGDPDGVRSATFGGGTTVGSRRAIALAVRAKLAVAPARRARAQLLVGGLGCFEIRPPG